MRTRLTLLDFLFLKTSSGCSTPCFISGSLLASYSAGGVKPIQDLKANKTEKIFLNNPIGFLIKNMAMGYNPSNAKATKKSNIRFFLRFDLLMIEFISITYKSPEVLIELLPMMERLSGGAIL